MKKEHETIFDQACRTADTLVAMFGQRCEVAVHDFSNLEESLFYLKGNLTNRKKGAPITNLVLQELKKDDLEIADITNYETILKTGSVLKSSTIFLRDSSNHVIGALCINYDISLLIQISGEIEELLKFNKSEQKTENFYSSVHEVLEDMVNSVLKDFPKAQTLLDMEEKIECVSKLEEKGAFLIKGSVEYLSEVLGVSKFTIYNYLKKIREEKEFSIKE
ncbi:helix-turn-helix transcriptional regulator [Ureibacillus manganicus]|uniref:YheO-like PAS domain protein n=1 Tax=Ureibacillus manganicus DSM 26584 TaxID=1384049 RepID=A0A0A3I4J6_9BACL|nr:PAS domain-containing protein [Ureibacillus manganicus]KGR77603.1 hypothetical protein CD29_14180 [Ureibacillus manganicus DSM 26584]